MLCLSPSSVITQPDFSPLVAEAKSGKAQAARKEASQIHAVPWLCAVTDLAGCASTGCHLAAEAATSGTCPGCFSHRIWPSIRHPHKRIPQEMEVCLPANGIS